MKKIYAALALMLFLLCGCGRADDEALQQHTWQLAAAQNAEGEIIAYGDAYENPPQDAAACKVFCTAADGVLTLEDKTSGESYAGTYAVKESGSRETIYDVSLAQTQGFAVSSVTEYEGGEKIPTLIISLGKTALTFFAVP